MKNRPYRIPYVNLGAQWQEDRSELLPIIDTVLGSGHYVGGDKVDKFEKNKYTSAISHLERAITMYPKPIGRFHIILAQMYLENDEIERARGHALKAQNINPHHEAPVALLKQINSLE